VHGGGHGGVLALAQARQRRLPCAQRAASRA
jgi:hypothetical protein